MMLKDKKGRSTINLHACSSIFFPIGEQEIDSIHSQTNATEPDNPRTWSATAVVQVTAMRERHGDILRCLSFHESYTAKSVPVEARLDIKCELTLIHYQNRIFFSNIPSPNLLPKMEIFQHLYKFSKSS